MCYSTAQKLEREIKWAMEQGDRAHADRLLKLLYQEIGRKLFPENYVLLGFDFPKMVVITMDGEVKQMEWGFVRWPIKDPEKLRASRSRYPNLNARSEGMFSSKSFAKAARSSRVVVPVNGFFEHHHKNKKTYPYFIYPKDEAIWYLGGISANDTFAICTTSGNELMGHIHNNPKLNGPRMPVILHSVEAEKWLAHYGDEEVEERILELCRPFDQEKMDAHTVGRLTGKEKVGNVEEAWKVERYEELEV